MNYAIHTFTTGPFLVNTRVLCAEPTHLAVIDPGGVPDALRRFLAEKKPERLTIILTHGHFDHIGGIAALIADYPRYELLIHPDDAGYLGAAAKAKHLQSFAPLGAQALIEQHTAALPEPTGFLREDTAVYGFSVIHTPGHTNGSVCLWNAEQKILFTGDTLFYRSRGRTDLLDGNEQRLQQSLDKLFSLIPDDTAVYPGHGPNTALGAEKMLYRLY